MICSRFLPVICSLFLATQTFAADTARANWKIGLSRNSGAVEFLAVGRPSAIKIRGKGTAPEGTITLKKAASGYLAQGVVSVELESLDTGIGTRTSHMKEKYLEVGNYPKAELELLEAQLPESFGQEDAEAKTAFRGTLTLHGVKKPVEGTVSVKRNSNSCSGHAEFSLKLADYAIAIPRFAGITVADDVSVSVDFMAPMSPN